MTSIERTPRSTPRVFDDDRDIYEQAYQNGNFLVRASIELDTQINGLKKQIYNYNTRGENIKLRPGALEALPEDTEILFMQAMAYVQKSQDDRVGTWNDYFRLIMQATTIDERVLADLVFMMYDRFDTRRNLINGVAGKNVESVEMILMTLDAYGGEREKLFRIKDTSELPYVENSVKTEHGQLRGALSEATIMALANYSQSPSKLALPARTYGDLYQKTDILYFYADDKTKHSYLVPIQVKTNRDAWKRRNPSPEGGFTLYMSDYDDSDDFTLARLLVAQHEPRVLDDREQRYLEAVRHHFDTDIKALRTEHPGIALPKIEVGE